MHVLFRPEARIELFDAQAWYEARALGLGLEFVRAFEAALQSACRTLLVLWKPRKAAGVWCCADFRIRFTTVPPTMSCS
ncbi:MAG TPA: hypothetical protein VIN58_08510 [Roseateles sp.]